MARGDRPAPDPRAVGHDPVPLEGVDVVRLLVEQAPLELTDITPPLLAVSGTTLLLIELVERPVDVAAVVDGAHVHRLELEQGQVRLDDVAAMEIGRDLEVAAEDGAVQHAQLERLDPDVEADLPPLVDEPHPEGVIG